MKKVAKSRRVGKELRLLDGEVAFVGVDVHKKRYQVSVWTAEREWVAEWTQPADGEALVRRLAPVRGQIARVVYEAGPTGFGLAWTLRRHGFNAAVVAPSKTPVSSSQGNKSDRRDAAQLARLDGKGMLTMVYVLTPQEEADRQVVRVRRQMVGEVGRTQRRIKSFLLQHGIAEPAGLKHWSQRALAELGVLELQPELRFCLDVQLEELAHSMAVLRRTERKVLELSASPRHAAAVARMRSVPGVGVITSMTFATELPHPSRFESAEAIAAITGLAPRVRRSGQKTTGGPILKTGNAHLRRVLVQASWQWVWRDPAARKLFGHLMNETGCAQKAIVAVARHLAILLWQLLANEDNVYTPGQPECDEPEPALAQE